MEIDEDWDLAAFGTVIFSYDGFLVGESDGFFTDNYSGGSLAKTGGAVELLYNDKVLDTVGYGSVKIFEGEKISTSIGEVFGRCVDKRGLMRDTDNNKADFSFAGDLDIGEYATCDGAESDDEGDISDELEPDVVANDCLGLRLSEIGANLANEKQFVEVENVSGSQINLKDCQIATAKSKKVFVFDEILLKSEGFLAVNVGEQGVKLIKTTSDTVYLRNGDGDVIDAVFYEKLKSGTSVAMVQIDDGEKWAQTFALTPDEVNVFKQYPDCSEGYARNYETGRCNKITTVSASAAKICATDQFLNPLTNRCKKIEVVNEKVCADGQFLNPETNRCKKIEVATVKTCAENQFLNPLTNRCKKVEVVTTAAPCAEGYERNPDTNRCRKIRENLGAGYAVDDSGESDGGSWAAIICLTVVGVVGLGYLAFSFRTEIWRFCDKMKLEAKRFTKRGKVDADIGA
jgi:hypothetical protein